MGGPSVGWSDLDQDKASGRGFSCDDTEVFLLCFWLLILVLVIFPRQLLCLSFLSLLEYCSAQGFSGFSARLHFSEYLQQLKITKQSKKAQQQTDFVCTGLQLCNSSQYSEQSFSAGCFNWTCSVFSRVSDLIAAMRLAFLGDCYHWTWASAVAHPALSWG